MRIANLTRLLLIYLVFSLSAQVTFAQCQSTVFTENEKEYLKTLFETALKLGDEPAVPCGTHSNAEIDRLLALRKLQAEGFRSIVMRGPAILPCLESLWERGAQQYPWPQAANATNVVIPPAKVALLEPIYCIDKNRALKLAEAKLSVYAKKAQKSKFRASANESDADQMRRLQSFLQSHNSDAWVALIRPLAKSDPTGWGLAYFDSLAQHDPNDPVVMIILSDTASALSAAQKRSGQPADNIAVLQRRYDDILYSWHYQKRDALYFEGIVQTAQRASQLCDAFLALHDFGRDDLVSKHASILEKRVTNEVNNCDLYFQTMHKLGRDDLIKKFAEQPLPKDLRESESRESVLQRHAKETIKRISAGQLDTKPSNAVLSCP